ncbi:MAG TPA: thioredoxin domain-containing protein [Gammaproteobacteria bacterium]|nr:thioredoxin domain-containing protein [Gammaproteobacteria bacterium]
MNDITHTNPLIHETSPYLLQHAHNPVDWHPWNDAALALARSTGKPILLSIGYSACHWCHVMAHESFEDPDTAALMNRLFVNIKVDREERPDLDRVYQLAHQILAQRGGGWPLTLFLNPDDLAPFFAGTYFPKTPRYGSPAFREVLTRVAAFYREHKDELQKQNAALQDVFKRIQSENGDATGELSQAPLSAAYRSLSENFDPRFGGFGRAPKFPHPASLEFLLRQSCDPGTDAGTKARSREMLDITLTRMAEGGIHDQLAGGFCRYSVDAQWMIPHFEKMLYDNGPLLALYAEAAKLTGEPLYVQTAHGIARWAVHEMQSPQGGYWSSLDADSEGHEGKYYVWDRAEVLALLSAAEYAVFAPYYGLDQPANFEARWHLHVQQTGSDNPETSARMESLLESARGKLLAARQQRVRPGLDDKLLTAWNGLMIRGMAVAGRLLGEPGYLASAQRAVDFIRAQLWKDGRLLASWRAGQAKLPAYLDDYAFLLDGVLELLQAQWNGDLFEFARRLADALLIHFEDEQHGGFWFTANDQSVPLHRSKTFSDESLPAGNAVAARALLMLGHLAAEPRYLEAAERAIKAALPGMNRYPDGHAAMLLALKDALEPPAMIVLRGDATRLQEWRTVLDQKFDPRRIVLAIPGDAENLTGLLAQCVPRGNICAYVCHGTQCSLPITKTTGLSAI